MLYKVRMCFENIIFWSLGKKNKQSDPLECLWTQPGAMRAKVISPGNCLWCLRDQSLAPVWPWGRDPSSRVSSLLCCSTVLVTNLRWASEKAAGCSLMHSAPNDGKKMQDRKKEKKKKGENKTWEIGLNMWGLDTVGWPCDFAVPQHRSRLCPSFPETASCTVLHVPWDLTTCLLISRDVYWGKIFAFTGEISLCLSWIAEELEGTRVTGNDVM